METGMVETILGLVLASWEKVEEQDHHLRDGGNYFNKQEKKKKNPEMISKRLFLLHLVAVENKPPLTPIRRKKDSGYYWTGEFSAMLTNEK